MPTIEFMAQIEQQSARIAALEAENAKWKSDLAEAMYEYKALSDALKDAHARESRLRAVVEQVEFATVVIVDNDGEPYAQWICSWCGMDKPHHAPDCARQAALAQTGEVKHV